MHNDRNVAENIRPILKAMERSIEAARRKRTYTDDPGAEHDDQPYRTPGAQATSTHHARTSQYNNAAVPQMRDERDRDGEEQPIAFDPTRLKARPKRRFGT